MYKILIVEDQKEVLELIDITLKKPDITILHAHNAEEAINIANNYLPDLIIMDIMMPGPMNGIDATRILKKSRKTKEIIILLISCNDQIAEIEKGYKSGADGYFFKPFSPIELMNKIEQILNTQKIPS